MKIIKRHKDSSGNTIGYTIDNNGNIKYFQADFVVSNYDKITNAQILSNGEFRANNGESIETVVDTKNLLVRKNAPVLGRNIGQNININDYYGKGYIDVCKRIRKYAIEGKLDVITEARDANQGKNIHLFELIKACGIGLKSFIKGYLSVIQPYSLTKFQESKKLEKGNTWLCDIGYKISMVIKLNETNSKKPLIVSFHESNIHSNNTLGQKDFSDKLCAVLVDKVNKLHNGYGVDYVVQRGFIRYDLHSSAQYYNNEVALVNYRDIKNMFDDTINLMFEQMQVNYSILEEESPIVITRKDTGKLSFMSMGFATVNNVYLMIDLFAQYTDSKSRALRSEITNNIIQEMPLLKQQELKSALAQKFGTEYNNKLYSVIQNMIT